MKAKISLIYIHDAESSGNPLALGYLKTYSDSRLKGRVSSAILDLDTAASLSAPGRAAAGLLRGKPDIVGFSCYLWNTEAVIAVAKALKKAAPGVRVILGGPDATGRGARILGDCGADVLVCGEGELTFADLLERFLEGRPWAGTPGTLTLSGGKAVPGPARADITDLDIIPSPYLAGLFDGKRYKRLVYETSRGCPFKCDFCSWTSKGKPRYFSVKRALAEAAWLVAHAPSARGKGTESFWRPDVIIADQDMALNGARSRRILGGIRRLTEGRNLNWVIYCGLERWAVELARVGNCDNFEFAVGIESMNPEALRLCGRPPVAPERIQEILAAARKVAPKARFVFQLILGMRGDDPAGFMKSLCVLLEACGSLQARPGAVPHSGSPALPRLETDKPLRAAIEVFHLAILPGSQLQKSGAMEGVDWDRRPPYGALAIDGFTPAGFDSCYSALEMVDMLTRNAVGRPMVRFLDIRPAAARRR